MSEERELPEGWFRVKLEEALFPGGTYNPRTGGDGEFLYVDIEAVDNKKQKIVSPKCILNAEAPSRAKMAIKTGDIIFSLVRPYLKNIAVVSLELDGQVASTAYCVMRPENGISSSFIFFSLLRESFINSIKTYGGTPPAARDDEFLSMTIPIAPLPEQQRIVSAIEERFTILDAVATALQQNKQKLKLARVSVLKHAVEGKLTEKWRAEHPATESGSELLERILTERRAKWEAEQLAKGKDPKKLRYEEPAGPDVIELLELPEEWCWVRAEQFCDFITKGTTPAADKLHSETGDIPFIKVYNLTHNGYLDFSVKPTFVDRNTHMHDLARSKVFPGDILMNIVGPPLGKVSIVPNTYLEWNINQAIAIFRPMPSYNRKLLVISILTEHILTWATKRAKTTAGQHNLTLEICRDLPLPMPPLAEQQQIVAEVERRLSVIDQAEVAVETSLKRIERARQSILEMAFSGRLVPQDPNDEPASVLLERIQEERGKRLAEGKLRGKNGGVKAARARKTKEQEFVPQWQLLRDAKQSGSIDGALGEADTHEDGASGRGEGEQGEMGKEELGDLVQMPLLSLWD